MMKFKVQVESSDILIVMSPVDEEAFLRKICETYLVSLRRCLLEHSQLDQTFLTSLTPLSYEPTKTWLDHMYEVAHKAHVGPMASVAGIISELMGKYLLSRYPDCELYIENGGDIFINSHHPIKVGVYAGQSSLSNRIAIELPSDEMPIGICTSAGTVGPSLSFGRADAVVVVSQDTALADAVATATGNRVQSSDDLQRALQFAMSVEGVIGVLIIIGDHMGVLGKITLTH